MDFFDPRLHIDQMLAGETIEVKISSLTSNPRLERLQ
jgi:hypothetical protein